MLNFQQALIRHVIYAIGSLVGLIPLVGFVGVLWTLVDNVSAAFDPQKSALHDRIANTYVVKK